MNTEENDTYILRACLNTIYDVCDEIDAGGTEIEFNGRKITLRKLFEIETTAYLLYLTASDKNISEEEIAFVNDLMSRTYYMEKCVKFINQTHMLEGDFGSTTPLSTKILSEYTREHGNDISEKLVKLYDGLGLALMNADKTFAQPEQQAHRDYIRLLRGYLELSAPEEEE